MKFRWLSSLVGWYVFNMGLTVGLAQSIYLNAGVFDTSQPPKWAATRSAELSTQAGLRLVQFDGPIQPEWVAQLTSSGFRVVDFIPDNTYLVYGSSAAVRALRVRATHVLWEGAYLAVDKINPRVHEKTPAQRRALNKGRDDFAIQLMQDEALNTATLAFIETLTDAPIRSVGTNFTLGFVNVVASLPAEHLMDIAAQPDVVSVTTWQPPRPRGERQGQIVANNVNSAGTQPTGPGYLAWLTSKGFTQAQFDSSGMVVDIADDGWDRGIAANPANKEFRVDGDAAKASRVKYSRYSTNLKTNKSHGLDGHGNLNISIVGGYNNSAGAPNVDGDGYHRGLGINPFALMGNTKVFADGGDWAPTDPQEAAFIATNYASGVRISSDSWGNDGDGSYDYTAQNYDTWTRDSQPSVSGNQQVLYVFAAGNDGPGTKSIGPPGSGKNIISVGASENYNKYGTDGCAVGNSGADNANDIIDFSSRGPCKDSRKKPDIVAPGTHVAGAASYMTGYTGEGVCDKYQPSGQTNYAASSGTSHSTPAVAGGASLVYQFFINQGWGIPSPAMMKAYLMNSTRYLTGVDANDTLPSNNQGMGRMNLDMAFDSTARMVRDQLTNDLFTATGQSRTFYGLVSDSGKPVRITLGWTDAPGSTFGNAYKNDLDLSVMVGGTLYKGNVFSGAWSIPGGSADVRNNVESVFLPPGTTGLVTMTVTAFNINSDGVPNYGGALDQDFVLVAYNAAEYTPSNYPPVLAPIGNRTTATNRLMQFTVAASDPVDGDSIRLWAEGIPAWATFAGATHDATVSGEFSGTTPAVTGTYAVTFHAADKDGTNSESIVITVNDINCVPAILLDENFDDSSAPPAGWVNTSTANDTDATHYKSAPNCRALGINTALETPPVNNPTQIVFYVDASSKGAGKTATLDYRIGSGEWTKVGNFTATTAGATQTFDLTGSPDLSATDNVSFRFSSTFSTWYLDDVVVRGMDCGGASVNHPPLISVAGGNSQSGSVGAQLSFVVTANDVDGDSLILQTNAAPTGASFPQAVRAGTAQSTFTWTPGATGNYAAVFTANDSKVIVTQSVSMAVGAAVEPLLPPTIQAASAIIPTQFNANWLAAENATGYRLDVSTNATFTGGGGVILAEDFTGFVKTNDGADVSADLDTYMSVSGWTGSKVFQDAGRAKLGANSGQGILITPALNLSGNGGNATLTFDLGKYSTDSTLVQVFHAADGSAFVQVNSDLSPPAGMEQQMLQIVGGTAASKIKIAAKGLSKNRFYLDHIEITGGVAGGDDYVPGYQNCDVGNVTTHAVTGLTEGVTYHYRVNAYNELTSSAYSETTNVTTIAGVDIPPILNPIGDKTVAVGETLQFQVTAIPTDSDPVTLTASNLPGTATFQATNEVGTFQWLNAGPTGVYSVTFHAMDKDGDAAETISISVNEGTRELLPPVVQAASNIQAEQFNANWLAAEHATGYRLDVSTNATFTGGGGGGVILAEDFTGFVKTNDGTDVSANLDTYMSASGWTGSKVYQDAGRAKLGASSGQGILTTPTLNLSGNGGNATLEFEFMKWTNDTTLVQVLHAPDGSSFTQVGADLTPPGTMTLQSVPIAGGTAASKISLQAKSASKNRFYLDNLTVSAGGGGSSSYVPGYEDRDVANVTTYVVTGLTEGVTYHYRVTAYNATSNSGYSAVTSVVTVASSGPSPVEIDTFTVPPGSAAAASFTSEVGHRYQLEYTLDLSANPVVWVVADSETGTGAAITLADDDPADVQRFYRVTAP